MLILMINLRRRLDRLAFMTDQLENCGLSFERIEAVDFLERDLEPTTPALSGPEHACALSHRKAWVRFLESGQQRCLILDDDVILSEKLKPFLDDPSNIPAGVDLLRLETMFMRTLLGPPKACRSMRSLKIHRMHSNHFGTAAYVISRAFAERLVRDFEDFVDGVDDILFAPTGRSFYPSALYQLRPALCVQAEWFEPAKNLVTAVSDLRSARRERLSLSVKGAAQARPENAEPGRPLVVRGRQAVSRWIRKVQARKRAFRAFLKTRGVWRDIPFAEPAVTFTHRVS